MGVMSLLLLLRVVNHIAVVLCPRRILLIVQLYKRIGANLMAVGGLEYWINRSMSDSMGI
jgi:hypothetical protein